MSKLCVIYNMAASYRAPVFTLMDKAMDIDWYFGPSVENINEINPSLLKNVSSLGRLRLTGPLYWQKGALKNLKKTKYQTFLMLGEPFCISTWAFCILKKLFFPKKKIYFWTHGWYGRESSFKKWLKRLFFGLGDGVFTYGRFAKEKAIEQGFNPEKIKVIHNSLDHDLHIKTRESLTHSDIFRRHFGNDYPTLLFIGRLTTVKKLHQVIEAMVILKEKGGLCNFVIVGDGPERSRLEAEAKKCKVPVWFYGKCFDDTETAELIFNADICVSPGNVGLTAIHSMSFGTPVITHNNYPNQMPEFEAIIDGQTGSFFEENSIDSLANSIHNWIASKRGKRDEVRKACYSEIDNYWTPEFQLKVLKDFIEQAQ